MVSLEVFILDESVVIGVCLYIYVIYCIELVLWLMV